MLSGAVAVTDSTDFLRNETVDGRDIIFYELDELDKLPDKLRYYMEHDDEAERIASNGYKLALEKHTWDNRAQELVKYLNRRQEKADH
jgi:spore maturation protein CgeB